MRKNQAIGQLVTTYTQKRRQLACIKSQIRAMAIEFKKVSDLAIGHGGDPEHLSTESLPEDSESLRALVKDMVSTREELDILEQSLRESDLSDLIKTKVF